MGMPTCLPAKKTIELCDLMNPASQMIRKLVPDHYRFIIYNEMLKTVRRMYEQKAGREEGRQGGGNDEWTHKSNIPAVSFEVWVKMNSETQT